jgi:TonB-dependent starch-binding outer membrane protein SusC
MRKLLLLLMAVVLAASQLSAQRTVTGKVTDDKGNPIPNASVIVKGTQTGTVTKPDGSYSLTVPATARMLVISAVDMESQEFNIGNQAAINVSLKPADRSLSEVIVVGYGTQKKKEVTGNLASVKGATISNKPVQSFDQALGGRAAGVQITIPNGVLNNPPVIRIRGTNSISLSSYPLIVLDGIPMFTGDASGTSAAGNALASINPNDIESIDIAKDAASAAIYGSRAANGVIYITTKKGRPGKARVNYDAWVGWTQTQRLPHLLNAQQYTDMKNEGLKNAGTYNATSNFFTLNTDASGNTIDTRWYDYVYRTGFSHNNNISVSGANEGTNYYFSFGYTSQEGIIKKNNFKKANILANIDQKAGKFLTVGGKIAFSNELNLAAASSGSLPGEAFATAGLGRVVLVNSPNVGPYLADGSYNINSGGLLGVMNNKTPQVGFYNPVASLDLNRQNSEANHLLGNVYLQLKPVNWITIKTVYGVDYLLVNNEQFASGKSGEGFVANSVGGSASSFYSQNKRWVWSNTAQFDKTIFIDHSVSLLAGTEQQYSNVVGYGLNRSIASDPFYTNIQGGWANIASTGLSIGENYLLSYFGRLQYNYKSKYFVSANIRRDGASQLGLNNKYGTFWGISAGWEITKEKFWESANLDKAFSSFKVRGSYGKVGNIGGLANYGTLSTYAAGLYGTNPSLVFSNAGNPDLTWETSTKTDVGISFGILKERITADIAYYKNNIDGLILAVQQPPSAGLPNAINTNVGTMYNKGYEVTINANLVSKRDFSWSTSFNLAHNKNLVTSLAPGLTQIITTSPAGAATSESVSITKPGYALGMIYVTRTAGVDPATGRRIFINAAGQKVYFDFSAPTTQRYKLADGTVYTAGIGLQDAQIYKNSDPKYFGGFDNTFRYKGFELNFLFTYQFGFYLYYGTNAGLHDQRYWNSSTDVLNRWQKPGDVTNIPRVVFGDNISNGSSYPLDVNVFKGDFIKLRTITLGYNLPKKIVDKVKLSNVRFYVSGQNLFINTDYPGPDPETSTNGNGTTNQGVDRNQVVNGRTITAGLNIAF